MNNTAEMPPGGPRRAEAFSLPTKMQHNASREYGPSSGYKPGQRVEFLAEDILFEGKREKGRWISGKVTEVYDYDPETPEYPGTIEMMCDLVKIPKPWDERCFETIEFPFHNV